MNIELCATEAISECMWFGSWGRDSCVMIEQILLKSVSNLLRKMSNIHKNRENIMMNAVYFMTSLNNYWLLANLFFIYTQLLALYLKHIQDYFKVNDRCEKSNLMFYALKRAFKRETLSPLWLVSCDLDEHRREGWRDAERSRAAKGFRPQVQGIFQNTGESHAPPTSFLGTLPRPRPNWFLIIFEPAWGRPPQKSNNNGLYPIQKKKKS